ncbi:hypothetical protein SKTS_23390 [Sulfurimicrobium lacus]|uniref:DUF2523 domain-containing protein n=1 Tax=Sulfurimicrobium lacus TaxID=2715678 RepID=A0A6F8VC84_9PROT|nr:DUF2523 family protein [Sulfurimicrobium lacus]BCB27453.1 hypothetical protein SKTS_23390 [Sulfurimicrobium lacus]
MSKLAVWIGSLVPSLVAKVLAALGMGVLTVTGFTIAWNTVKGMIIANFTAMPATILGLASLAGVGEALGIIFGAITARVAYTALISSSKIVGMK